MARESLLVIIEKYDGFVNYIYPVVQNMERKHGTVKEMITQSIFIQVELLEKFGECDGVGIPIGNLLSQLCANIYGHIFDRYIKEVLREKHYFRYMDDTVILSNDKEHLKKLQKKLQDFITSEMRLKFSKWMIASVEKQVNFLGYRITPKYKLVRKDSVTRAKRKIKRYTKNGEREKLFMFLASWYGHVKTADSHNLKSTIGRIING